MTHPFYITFLPSEVRVSKEKMPRNPALTDATNTNSVEEKLIYSAWLSDSTIVDRDEDKEKLKEKVYISDKDEWPGGDFNKYAPVPSKSYGPFEIEVEVVDEMTDGWVPSYNDPDNPDGQMTSEPTGRKVARLRAEKEKPVQSGFDTLKGRIENSAHSFTEGAEVGATLESFMRGELSKLSKEQLIDEMFKMHAQMERREESNQKTLRSFHYLMDFEMSKGLWDERKKEAYIMLFGPIEVKKEEAKPEGASEFFQVGFQGDVVGDFFEQFKGVKDATIEVQEFKNSDCRVTVLVKGNRAKAIVFERRTDFNDLEFIKFKVVACPAESESQREKKE